MANESPTSLNDSNLVRLVGKVSRNRGLKYTPHGTPLCEFTVAATQRFISEESMGYFDIVLVGTDAQEWASQLKIGKSVSLIGSLWMREYRNRSGARLKQMSVIIDKSLAKNEISFVGGNYEEDGREGRRLDR